MADIKRPLILALINDLFFGMRVRNTAEKLGYSLNLVENESEFGESASFSDHLATLHPKLIILDLHNVSPWRDWLRAAKSDESLAKIPWLAFGSHKSDDLLKDAKQLGVDKVVAKSKFTENLPGLIQSLAGK